jgi:hypothetical protein
MLTPIRLFRADPMTFTPFSVDKPLHAILAGEGISFVDVPSKADIIIARREKKLKAYGSYNKSFAIWSHEPRFNYRPESSTNIPGIRNPVHIMNAYNGTIYTDNFYYFQDEHEFDFDKMRRIFADKPHRAVMLASYRRPPTPVVLDCRNIDLLEYRQKVAVDLLEFGFCDIYGRDWPAGTKTAGNSREGNWSVAKREILKHYAINIAFENTIIPHYVTEKLWDAVLNACLPVYHGTDNRIYELFPEQSFIEASGKSTECLADEVINMSAEEMETRYDACLGACINVYAKDRRRQSREACLLRTVRFLHSILSYAG